MRSTGVLTMRTTPLPSNGGKSRWPKWDHMVAHLPLKEQLSATIVIAKNMHKDKPLLTCRYEETAGDGRLQIWGVHSRDGDESIRTYSGPIESLPEWMRSIRDIALVGGHMPYNPHPPPTHILWFETDPQFNLQGFVRNVPT